MTRSTKQLPLRERMELYEEAKRLHDENGWGNKKVARELELSPATVGNWLYKGVSPDDGLNYHRDDGAGPDLLEKPSEDFLIWFAGFWEGEGHYRVRYPGNGMRAEMGVTQTKERGKLVCKELEAVFDCGDVTVQRSDNKNHAPCYTWSVGKSNYIHQITGWITPHLRVREDELQMKRDKMLSHMEESSMWTPNELEHLAENWKAPPEILAEELGRTKESVKKKRRRLGYYHK